MKSNCIDKKGLFRLLKKLEIPVATYEDGKFKDLVRLDAIKQEVEGSKSKYRNIKGKNNYFKLYGQDTLEKH
jgi:hypothetical protein